MPGDKIRNLESTGSYGKYVMNQGLCRNYVIIRGKTRRTLGLYGNYVTHGHGSGGK